MSNKLSQFDKHYFAGINYLLNEQADKAIDIFVRVLDVNQNTLETHLLIGSVFRRRGEVERAIRIHQNLISQVNLKQALRSQVLVELGRDYLSAGVYNRAEQLFLEVIESMDECSQKHRTLALRYLLTIYQTEKDGKKLLTMRGSYRKKSKKTLGN
ncbi:MAG: hypothetical protein JKY13_00915 [Gammaproteobacteria bacterium]|nr:hypothetical protein [Gammaproteobacteria bacterium]